jgi:hypothetical protein
VIARRWEEWRPWAELRATSLVRDTVRFDTLMNLYRDQHRRRLVQLRAAGVRLVIIERDRLDDPLESEFNAQARIARAIKLKEQYARRYDRRTRKDSHAD